MGIRFQDQGLDWWKSSASNMSNCVEVAGALESPGPIEAGGRVLVRHTKDRDGAVLSFTVAEWSAFLVGVQRGEFTVAKLLPTDAKAASVKSSWRSE